MSAPRFHLVADRRAIIDRRAVGERLAQADRNARGAILKAGLADGRREIARRLSQEPARGRTAAASMAYLADQIVRLSFDAASGALGDPNESIALVGLGGTGRGEMAPYSDVDLLFLVPKGAHGTLAPLVEATLYLLWQMDWKVGHAIRDADEVLASSAEDISVRTAFMESRWIWGDQSLFEQTRQRFDKDFLEKQDRDFVAAKMAERDERHRRMGDSRYLVEPNVKDGKGGLRDLQTLRWIAKQALAVESNSGFVEKCIFSEAEYRRFERAERFFWAVRCHLHFAAGRHEERLGFDYQRQIAQRMHYSERPGKSAVERFMHFYFLQAKAVGDLTGVFLAQLDDRLGARGRRFALPTFRRRPSKLNGFCLDRGRLSVPGDDFLAEKPVRLIELFALAAREGLEVHPKAMRLAARDARLVDRVRDDPQANALFLEVLTCKNHPDVVLRWMNEAGVFGRFVPDFGRVVAQMQFDMYHHYTVDEHTIRAIGLLAAIERGELAKDHPLSTALFRQLGSRRVLYVAVLLHDIAKGRGGDHSEIGAEIALELCPRFGLDAAETETVAWLVRNHLLMSRTAQRRDISDPTTIADFAEAVQSPERLRLLLMLTVVDTRAVGPGTWNDWKRRLLRQLYDSAEERLRLGHKQRGRSERIALRQQELREELDWPPATWKAHARRLPESYWLAEPLAWQKSNALQIANAEARIGDLEPSVIAEDEPELAATRISIFSPDRVGLFYRISAGLASAGASIIDARIHTSRDGMALDNLLVHNSQRLAYADRRLRNRLVRAVEKAITSENLPLPPSAGPLEPRSAAFHIAPSVIVAPRASNRTTVVEVNARDRSGLLARLALAIHTEGHQVHSAHIATYGERAVDTFYLTNAQGRKLTAEEAEKLRAALLGAAAEATSERDAA
ncbi:[protein-PII] uridylyltransferase [Sphingomonas sp. HDW15A]|uniref:[protein-PII] uridylyltransferase n=1 Tax=Sphingomonas sp. HDW15A TaxID=2714942 RepID=UPI00140D4A9C|nr:[protein-PII] uridylyltransferase [Sphingomonas sp. HDW15A]QIK96855.1 [protein-PII] uridylyltransferase [Sphingomonas sp. HDW15A]